VYLKLENLQLMGSFKTTNPRGGMWDLNPNLLVKIASTEVLLRGERDFLAELCETTGPSTTYQIELDRLI